MACIEDRVFCASEAASAAFARRERLCESAPDFGAYKGQDCFELAERFGCISEFTSGPKDVIYKYPTGLLVSIGNGRVIGFER